MKISNNYNLPQPVYDAIARDNYIRGDNNYSVTELIESPRVVQLKRRHWDDLTEDAIDRVWSIFGHAVHHVMETHASDESFVEQRYYIERFGRTVGGMVDCFNDGLITDYKVTSAWSIIYGSRDEHWHQQLNLYAHILRENGLEVNKLQIVAFLRDWDRNKAKQDKNYPQVPLLIIPIRVWSSEECEEFLASRLALHIENEERPNQSLIPCSSEEMWAKQDIYALYKRGSAKATRVFDNDSDLHDYLFEKNLLVQDPASFSHREILDANWEIQIRKGARTRCESYCSLAPFCTQYQNYKNGEN